MSKLNIPIIQGTTRPKRKSIHASRYIFEIAKTISEIEPIFVDPNDFNIKGDGNDDENKDPKYTKITAAADGFFIVSPEYNHSFPGSLKHLLDSELKNYNHKPVAFAGVSSGPWGGTRAIEALVSSVREMGLIASAVDVQFPGIGQLFDEQGKIQDAAYEKRVRRAFDELIWLAKVLKQGRENHTA